jgi:hypothetical protein
MKRAAHSSALPLVMPQWARFGHMRLVPYTARCHGMCRVNHPGPKQACDNRAALDAAEGSVRGFETETEMVENRTSAQEIDMAVRPLVFGPGVRCSPTRQQRGYRLRLLSQQVCRARLCSIEHVRHFEFVAKPDDSWKGGSVIPGVRRFWKDHRNADARFAAFVFRKWATAQGVP